MNFLKRGFKKFFQGVIKFTIYTFYVSLYLVGLAGGLVLLSSETSQAIFIWFYIGASFLVWGYFAKRKTLQGDKSFSAVAATIKKDLLVFLKQVKDFFAGVFILAFIALIVYVIGHVLVSGGSRLFGPSEDDTAIMQQHPNYDSYKQTNDCSYLEPDNPYDYDSGHYAGFEWGQNGNYCDGNSDSFIEGCQEYESQEDAYQTCLNNN